MTPTPTPAVAPLAPETRPAETVTPESIPMSEWIWDGHAGHFIGSANCRFHLNTRVGDYRVSTVGDYFPASTPGGAGAQPIGAGRTHETFVFRVTGPGPGEVETYNEIDTDVYNDCEDARRGHRAMCVKYAALQAPVPA